MSDSETPTSEPESASTLTTVIEADKEGFLTKRAGSTKKKQANVWKPQFFQLFGSSLFYYKTAQDNKPGGEIQLKGATLAKNPDEKDLKKREFVFVITTKAQTVYLSASSQVDFDSWTTTLEEAKEKEPVSAPEREKTKRGGSFAQRAQRTMASKAMASGAGKAALKSVVNDEVSILLKALRKMVTRHSSKKRADDIESSIVKILMKSYFLEKNKQVTMEDFYSADRPLRRCFSLLVKVAENSYRMREDTLTKYLTDAHETLREVESIFAKLLMPHLKPKTMNRVHEVLGYLGSMDFLRATFTDDELEDELLDLCEAMNRYNAFSF